MKHMGLGLYVIFLAMSLPLLFMTGMLSKITVNIGQDRQCCLGMLSHQKKPGLGLFKPKQILFLINLVH